MTLMSHHSYGGSKVGEGKMAILKKDVWCNDEGECVESDGMPKGWAKAKLMGRAGQEFSDAEIKSWNIVKTKAKAPKENKAK